MLLRLAKTKRFVVPAVFGLLLVSFLLAPAALALETGLEYGTFSGLGTQDLRISVMQIVRVILGFLGVLALIIFFYGGFVWMTAAGNPERINTAKRILTNAVIGLVIILTAFGIVSFIINVLVEATIGPPVCNNGDAQACSVGGCAGSQVCVSGTWSACSPFPGCIPINECRVVAISPTSPPDRPINSVARVRFTGSVDPTTIDLTTFQVLDLDNGNAVVPGTFVIAGNLVEFTPDAFCLPPNDPSLHCFTANTNYEITVVQGSIDPDRIQCGGFDLTCGLGGECSDTFKTGGFVDTQPPSGYIIGNQICQIPNNSLQARVNDDFGIAYVDFHDLTDPLAPITLGTDFNVSVPPEETASIQWDGTVYPLGSTVTVDAELVDFDLNTFTTVPLDFEIRAATCCNNIQDPGETGIDCGGGCEACAPVIEWVAPGDGAPDNLVTIHGRHFGATPGQVDFSNAAGDPVVTAQLANAVNPLCSDAWNDNEIVAVVPAAAEDGPLQVTDSISQLDRTDQPPGSLVPDFDVNTTIRPGICTLIPPFGQVSDPVTVAGLNFTPGSTDIYFSAAKAGGIPIVSPTQIQGVSVPSLDLGDYGVRALDLISSEFSNPKTFTVGAGEQTVVGAVGSQVDRVALGSTNQYLGGAFSLIETAATPRTVTAIRIGETGTIDALTDLTNVRLLYELDTLAPYNCQDESYNGSENQFGIASNFSGPDGSINFIDAAGVTISQTATMCVYVVLDISSTAPLGSLIDVEINYPPADVTVLGFVGPNATIEIPGSTEIVVNPLIGADCNVDVGAALCTPDPARCGEPNSGLVCDPSSCTCQLEGAVPDQSTYWSAFQTGIQPGACSANEGLCIPDDTLCGFEQFCDPFSCNCAPLPSAQCLDNDTAVILNGSTSFIEAPNTAGSFDRQQMTYEAWIRPQAFSGFGTVFNRTTPTDANKFLVQINPTTDQWRLVVTKNASQSVNQTGDFTFDVGTWYHLAISFGPNQAILYINGDPVAQGSFVNLALIDYTGISNLFIGSHQTVTPSEFFNGRVDDVAVYGRILSDREIFYLAQNRRMADANLISLWRFSEGIGATTADSAGSNDAALQGGAAWAVGHFPCAGTISCDLNLATPICEPDTDKCVSELGVDYICDFNTCTCQAAGEVPEAANPDQSTYFWSFTTTSFGPRVVETCNRTDSCGGSISSPTPFSRPGTNASGHRVSLQRPDDGPVPIDSIFGAQFTELMYVPALTNSNIVVYDCGDASIPLSESNCTVTVPGTIEVNACVYLNANVADTHCFNYIPNSLLQPNHWYQVRLNAVNITGQNGVRLAGNDLDDPTGGYRWAVQTRNSTELSKVACLFLKPSSATLYAYDARQQYSAIPSPDGFNCVEIRPESCSLDGGVTESYAWNIEPGTFGDPTAAEIVQPTDPAPFSPHDDVLTDHLASAAARKHTVPQYVDTQAICQTAEGDIPGTSELYIDFSRPVVIDRFPDCGTACLNSLVGATFSKNMEDVSVTNAIDLYICYDDQTCNMNSAAGPTADLVSNFIKPISPNPAEAPNTYTGSLPCFDFNNDGNNDYCLLPNTYYRVIIQGGDNNPAAARASADAGGKTLGGLNFDSEWNNFNGVADSYSWIFKTQRDFGLCLPGAIDVNPADYHAQIDDLIPYAARPRTAPDMCDPDFGQRLDPYSWNWAWQSTVTTTADLLTDAGLLASDGGNLRDSCGNGFVEVGEDCDDGNIVSGDGCSGLDVFPNSCLNEGANPAYGSICGNGLVETGEDCDDSNTVLNPTVGDYCDTNCLWVGNTDYTLQVCGNGIVERLEQCDPPGLGCTNQCRFSGTVTGFALCGDGQLGPGEECDMGELATCITLDPNDTDPSDGINCLVFDRPQTGDGDNCSATCLIEDRSTPICRSQVTNKFAFRASLFNSDCSIINCATEFGANYYCTQLSNAPGNSNTIGAVCTNRIIEAGEECDLGGTCSDNPSAPCTAYNVSACADPTTATCVGQSLLGCTNQCLQAGSYHEGIDPPDVGAYQIVQALDNGETFIQSWISSYAPPDGPLGEGHLLVGTGLSEGPFSIIDEWPNCSNACINAAIGAQFSTSSDPLTVDPSTVFLYECGSDANCEIAGRGSINNIGVAANQAGIVWDYDFFDIILPPNYNPVDDDQNPQTPVIPTLLPNTWYRVVVHAEVLGSPLVFPKEERLSGLNYDDPNWTDAEVISVWPEYLVGTANSYSWKFKTQADPTLCSLDSVTVHPKNNTLVVGGDRDLYFAQPRSAPDQCSFEGQRLNAYQFTWDWDTEELTPFTPPLPLSTELINGADFLFSFVDGCGNGVRERGEDCDRRGLGLEFPLGCNPTTCLWEGTTPVSQGGVCGNGIINPGEECDDGDNDTFPDGFNGEIPDYCGSNCLLIGNINYGVPVCGNGIVEAGEQCDNGAEPNGNDRDGCTDICIFAGAVPGGEALCGDGLVDFGEECDEGELAFNDQPLSNDDYDGDGIECTGTDFGPNSVCAGASRSDCQDETGLGTWCYWTGAECRGRACLNANDFPNRQAAGNNEWSISVCGNAEVELGEQCDDGNTLAGYCSLDGSSCDKPPGTCQRDGTCDGQGLCELTGSGIKYLDLSCVGNTNPCTINGQCIADGCGPTCLNNGSAAQDNRPDPFQIVETVPQFVDSLDRFVDLDEVNEEIRAWHRFKRDRVGVANLRVLSRGVVPFVVIGHQPAPDPDFNSPQCRNVAMWAVFSQQLKLDTLYGSCTGLNGSAGSQTPCLSTRECGVDEFCAFTSFQVCENNCSTAPNLVASLQYQTVQGVCNLADPLSFDYQKCSYPLADFENTPMLSSSCTVNSDCRGSRVTVTSLYGGFAGSNPTGEVGFLDENTVYEILVNENQIESIGDDPLLCSAADTSQACIWHFITNNEFCECDYIGVTIDHTSGGSETVKDSFFCASNFCGAATPLPIDDDYAPQNVCTGGDRDGYVCNPVSADSCPGGGACVPVGGGVIGNQHRYNATCYDIDNSVGERIPLSPFNLAFEWSEIDKDDILYLAQSDLPAGSTPGDPLGVAPHDANIYVTPGENGNDINQPGNPDGKNGKAKVKVAATEYVCSDTGTPCNFPAGGAPCGSSLCQPKSGAQQNIDVLNFICENPWPDLLNFPYEDNFSNPLINPDTNFLLYYCRDAGGDGFEDDLPRLNDQTPIIIGQGNSGLGQNVIKDFIFPFGTSAGSQVIIANQGRHVGGYWKDDPTCTNTNGFQTVGGCNRIPGLNFTVPSADNYAVALTTFNFRNAPAPVSFDLTIREQADPNLFNPAINYNGHRIRVYLKGPNDASPTPVNDPTYLKTEITHRAFDENNPQSSDIFLGDLAPGDYELAFGWFNDYCSCNGGNGTSMCGGPFDTACDANVMVRDVVLHPTGESTDAIGVRVLKNPLHLSPETWYQSGLCRIPGQATFDNICFSDADCPLLRYCDANGSNVIDDTEITFGNECSTNNDCPTGPCLPVFNNCQLNVPLQGSPQSLLIDGYQAVLDGRTVYVSATNFSNQNPPSPLICEPIGIPCPPGAQFGDACAGGGTCLGTLTTASLFSNMYLLSFNQGAANETVEIFRRILDPEQQAGVWSFNSNFTNNRLCTTTGKFRGTDVTCGPAVTVADQRVEIGSSLFSYCFQFNTDPAACDAHTETHGCSWVDQADACLALTCEPIYCTDDSQCPDLRCDANKEELVRDAKRYGDLRDTQLFLERFVNQQGRYPTLGGGSFIASTTFSIWPSWQQTFGAALGTQLAVDPLNRFVNCPLDNPECWNQDQEVFYCPADAFTYAYRAAADGITYELYTNFEYQGLGSWRTRPAAPPDDHLYDLPLASLFNNQQCRVLDFEVHQATVAGGTTPNNCIEQLGFGRCWGSGNNPAIDLCTTLSDCPSQLAGTFCSADADADGWCDDILFDNCRPLDHCLSNRANCYNPDQRDSNGDGLGDVCDSTCSSDIDHDGVCDETDICPNVVNPSGQTCVGQHTIRDPITGQCDADRDGIGDACDPCTDLDRDGSWDINTGANVCGRDKAPALYIGFCQDQFGLRNGQRCRPGSVAVDCAAGYQHQCLVPFGSSAGVGNGISDDHRSYCVALNPGAPAANSVFNISQFTNVACASNANCSAAVSAGQITTNNTVVCQDFANITTTGIPGLNSLVTYNPLQEDFDQDLVGYIADDCIDFDADGFGDWPFFTQSSDPVSTLNLTANQRQHFQGCQSLQNNLMSPWVSAGICGDNLVTGLELCEPTGYCDTNDNGTIELGEISAGNICDLTNPFSCDADPNQHLCLNPTLPGVTMIPGVAPADIQRFMLVNQCVSCNPVGTPNQCTPPSYLNCGANFYSQTAVPGTQPTKYLWISNTYADTVSQMIALDDPALYADLPSGPWQVGDIVHEYQICQTPPKVCSDNLAVCSPGDLSSCANPATARCLQDYYTVDLVANPGATCNFAAGDGVAGQNPSRTSVNAESSQGWIAYRGHAGGGGVALFNAEGIDPGLVKFCDGDIDINNDGILGPGTADRFFCVNDPLRGDCSPATALADCGDPTACVNIEMIPPGDLHGARGVAIDRFGDAWAGGINSVQIYKISQTPGRFVGDCEAEKTVNLGHSVYGMAMDTGNNLWAVGGRWLPLAKGFPGETRLSYVRDPNLGSSATIITDIAESNQAGGYYGIGLDLDGNAIVSSGFGPGPVYKFVYNPQFERLDRSTFAFTVAPSGGGNGNINQRRGVGIDVDGNMWLARVRSSTPFICSADPTVGTCSSDITKACKPNDLSQCPPDPQGGSVSCIDGCGGGVGLNRIDQTKCATFNAGTCIHNLAAAAVIEKINPDDLNAATSTVKVFENPAVNGLTDSYSVSGDSDGFIWAVNNKDGNICRFNRQGSCSVTGEPCTEGGPGAYAGGGANACQPNVCSSSGVFCDPANPLCPILGETCVEQFCTITPAPIGAISCFPTTATNTLDNGSYMYSDFLGLNRALVFRSVTNIIPAVGSAATNPAMEAFAIPRTNLVTELLYQNWHYRWGKILYTSDDDPPNTQVKVYVCFSDEPNDVGCIQPSSNRWVPADLRTQLADNNRVPYNYNSNFANPSFQRRYLRLKVVLESLDENAPTISNLRITCLNDSGQFICQ